MSTRSYLEPSGVETFAQSSIFMTVFVFSVIRSGCLPSVGVSACATPTDARSAAPRTAPVKFLVSLDFRNPKICFCCMLFLSIAIHAPIGCDSKVLGLVHQNVPMNIISLFYRECKQMSRTVQKKEPKRFFLLSSNPQSKDGTKYERGRSGWP